MAVSFAFLEQSKVQPEIRIYFHFVLLTTFRRATTKKECMITTKIGPDLRGQFNKTFTSVILITSIATVLEPEKQNIHL